MKTTPRNTISPAAPARPNRYSGYGLDRAGDRRKDPDWLKAAWSGDNGRCLVVWQQRNLVTGPAEAPAAVRLPTASLPADWQDWSVFLGLAGDDSPLFVVDLTSIIGPVETPEDHPCLKGSGRFDELRTVGPLMSADDAGLCAYGRGMAWWHQRHGFCGVCGAQTRRDEGGHVRSCTNPACATQHFPRTDPAVIMLVHDGADRVILGRNVRFPPAMYSVLAGFVEPGESLEDTVAREVFEEVGVQVTDIRYHSSQPWPFPGSLMLGYTARAVTFDLKIDPDELEHAGWYQRDWLKSLPTEDPPLRLARTDSIARRLIDDWLNQA